MTSNISTHAASPGPQSAVVAQAAIESAGRQVAEAVKAQKKTILFGLGVTGALFAFMFFIAVSNALKGQLNGGWILFCVVCLLPVLFFAMRLWPLRDPMRAPIVRALVERSAALTNIRTESIQTRGRWVTVLLVELGKERYEVPLWEFTSGQVDALCAQLEEAFPKAWLSHIPRIEAA